MADGTRVKRGTFVFFNDIKGIVFDVAEDERDEEFPQFLIFAPETMASGKMIVPVSGCRWAPPTIGG